jgi:hypothetical protein
MAGFASLRPRVNANVGRYSAMPINWVAAYNRLFEIIDAQGDTYFSGPRFIGKVREIDPYYPSYRQFIDARNREGRSTSRREYFHDILLGLEEPQRIRLLESILDEVHLFSPERVQVLRDFLGDAAHGQAAVVPQDAWRADRLNESLAEIDHSIQAGNFERAITLSYTTLEGFYKAFLRRNAPEHADLTEIIALSREVKRWLSTAVGAYPEETLNLVNSISHAIDRARNRFSEAHFEEEAARWLAVYVRDLLNTQVRLLLHFM